MPSLAKIFYTFASLILTALIAMVSTDVWRSHAYIRTQGVEGVLSIGQKYNASRWAEPLPLKKIHVYTATLATRYAVLLETDQDLAPGSQVFIRHLALNDSTVDRLDGFLRPVSGRIRMRSPAEAKPPGEATAAPPPLGKNAAAFLIGGANDGTLELIWRNSGAGEWIVLFVTLFLLQAFAINAWTLPWRVRKPGAEDKHFVHPALRAIEAGEPPAPVAKIAFKPKPPDAGPAGSAAKLSATERTLKLPRK
jgi:hypothetical protein